MADRVDTIVDPVEAGEGAAGPFRPLLEQYGRRFSQGEVLFREGEPATQAFLLHEGRVRLLKRVRMVERSLTVVRAGDLFGEGALLEGGTRSSTALALGDGVAVALDAAAFRRVLETFPSLSERLVMQLVHRLREAEDQNELLMVRDTQSKVITALLKMIRATAGAAELALSPVELSSRVGLDVDTVKGAMQRLRDQQYVRIRGDRIEVLDVDALRRLYQLLGAKEELRGER